MSPGSCGSRNAMGPDPGVAASQQSQILAINWLIRSVLRERQLLSTSHSAAPAQLGSHEFLQAFSCSCFPRRLVVSGASTYENGRRAHLLPLYISRDCKCIVMKCVISQSIGAVYNCSLLGSLRGSPDMQHWASLKLQTPFHWKSSELHIFLYSHFKSTDMPILKFVYNFKLEMKIYFWIGWLYISHLK